MIEAFWKKFCLEENNDIPIPDAWMFGDGTKTMGNELANLVLLGKKTATCSAFDLYNLRSEPIPKLGQYDIILNGHSEPVAIIKNKSIEIFKMDDVPKYFATKEGEGDLSYDYWYSAHKDFFKKEFKTFNLDFSTDMTLICETFVVVYPK